MFVKKTLIGTDPGCATRNKKKMVSTKIIP